MADWKCFEIDPQTERRILASVLEVIRAGYGSILITVHKHKITDIAKTEKERMAEETTPSPADNGLESRQ